jgi:hypothetical protein
MTEQLMTLTQCLELLKSSGYKITKPRAPKTKPGTGGIKTVNPFNHPYPHAKLYNNTLTSIERLRKVNGRLPMVKNDDLRNWSISGKPPVVDEGVDNPR